MMENRNLSKIEIIVILLSAAFIPLMSLLIGVAIFSIFIDAPNMITQMYGERLFFAVSAVTLWYILNKIIYTPVRFIRLSVKLDWSH
ncbi:hypothetical protein [Staphylococcus felis]|uniref:hypothetical protein n=1 Tax=Staphylococcus felis TaxID=46127 RepID=UPI0032DBD36D